MWLLILVGLEYGSVTSVDHVDGFDSKFKCEATLATLHHISGVAPFDPEVDTYADGMVGLCVQADGGKEKGKGKGKGGIGMGGDAGDES